MTFVAVLGGWVLLRSPSPEMALRSGRLCRDCTAGARPSPARGLLSRSVGLLLVVTNSPLESFLLGPARSRGQSWALAVLLVLSLLSFGGRSPFLYFQF